MGLLDYDILIGINICTFVFLNIKICKIYVLVFIKTLNVLYSILF